MRCYLVTEEPYDVALLEKLLGEEFLRGKGLTFTNGGGWSGADSLARSLLAIRQEPVVIVADADSNERRRIANRKGFLIGSLGQCGSLDMYEVVVAVPEIEVVYFEDKEALEALTGVPMSDAEFAKGKRAPRRALFALLGNRKDYHTTLLQNLTEEILAKMRESTLARDLRQAILHIKGQSLAA